MGRIICNNICLKPININDIEQIREWRNEENKNKTFINSKFITLEEQEQWYEVYKRKSNDLMYIIIFENIPVGIVSLYSIDYEKKEAEFGRLLIGESSSRGKNLGVKVTNLLCDYGFKNLNLERITLEVLEDNIYAYKTYINSGFKEIGERYCGNKKLIVMELRNNPRQN